MHSFYLELGGDLGLPQHLLAALGIGLRQGCGRGGRGGKRRRPDGDPAACRGRPCGGIRRTYTNKIIYVCQNCEPLRSTYLAPMPGHWGSPRGPSGELLGAHTFHLSATQLMTGCGAWRGRLLEHSRCFILAHRDRASGGTLGGGHAGSVQPSQGGLRGSRDLSGEFRSSRTECLNSNLLF